MTKGHSVAMRSRFAIAVSTNLFSAKRRAGAAPPGTAAFSRLVASCAKAERHWLESAVRKCDIAASSSRVDPLNRLSSADERTWSSAVVASAPPVATERSRDGVDAAGVVFDAAMIRSSCSSACGRWGMRGVGCGVM